MEKIAARLQAAINLPKGRGGKRKPFAGAEVKAIIDTASGSRIGPRDRAVIVAGLAAARKLSSVDQLGNAAGGVRVTRTGAGCGIRTRRALAFGSSRPAGVGRPHCSRAPLRSAWFQRARALRIRREQDPHAALAVARASRASLFRWQATAAAGGLAALAPQPRGPRRPALGYPAWVEQVVIPVRLATYWNAKRIAAELRRRGIASLSHRWIDPGTLAPDVMGGGGADSVITAF